MKEQGGFARGTYQWQMSGPLLAVAWLDNKAVYILSSNHCPEFLLQANAETRFVWQRGTGEERGRAKWRFPCPPLLEGFFKKTRAGLIKLIKCLGITLVSGKHLSGAIMFFFMR